MKKEPTLEIQSIGIELESLSDIMFDRFYSQEKDTRPPEQKLYLGEDNAIVLPSENIHAFLFSEKGGGCAKSFEGRRGKEFIRIGQAHVIIEPYLIPFNRHGKPLIFNGFDNDTFWISEFAPTTKLSGGGIIKQPMRRRPVLRAPWGLTFTVKLVKNVLIDETRLYNWFVRGGIEIGLGNYRPRFGRFTVQKFA